jgi:hypothetical protein
LLRQRVAATPSHEAKPKAEPKPKPKPKPASAAIPAGIELGTPGYLWDPDKLTNEDWDRIVQRYAISQNWACCLGPVPGYLGCKAPAEVLYRHGFDVRVLEPGGMVKVLLGFRTGAVGRPRAT